MKISDKKPFYVVTGMHRSGTTLVGKILSKNSKLHVIHEPLNKEYGLRGVKHVYPCDLDPEQNVYYLELLNSFLSGKAEYIHHSSLDGRLKALARKLSGGRTAIDFIKLRTKILSGQKPLPLLKDPFEILLSEQLIKNGSKVIILIRHPVAIWCSIKRMGWKMSYLDFAYPEIFNELGLAPDKVLLDNLTEIEKFAWLWMAIYQYVFRLVNNDGALFVKHEDLCISPYDQLERMESFLGIDKSKASHKFISKNMFANTIVPSGNKIHTFERDAASLVSAWYGKFEKEENIIQEICGSLVEKLYGSWSPK